MNPSYRDPTSVPRTPVQLVVVELCVFPEVVVVEPSVPLGCVPTFDGNVAGTLGSSD